MEQKKKVYIAGPITGDPDYERKFNAVEKELTKRGYWAVNPILGNDKRKDWTYKQYIDRGLNLLMCCDYICITDVWIRSKGLDVETAYAEAVGIPKLYAMESPSGEWSIE